MANQSASNKQPRPASDILPPGCKILTGSRCSLSQMPPNRITALSAHHALVQILADESEDIGASDYRNDNDFESEISADLCHDSNSRSKSDAAKPTATQPDGCLSSRGQFHGRRHDNGRVAQSERGHRAATNIGPCANRDNVDSDNIRNTKPRNI